MVSPVVVGTDGSRTVSIAVSQRYRGHAARHLLVVVDKRSAHFTGILGIKVGDVHIAHGLPMFAEVVSQLEESGILLKGVVGAVSVGASIVQPDDGREFALADALGQFALHRAVGTGGKADVALRAVLLHLSGDDVDHTSHSIGAIQSRGRSPKHLHTLGQHRLVSIGNGVAIETCILGHTVNQYQHSGIGTAPAHSAQGESSGRTV